MFKATRPPQTAQAGKQIDGGAILEYPRKDDGLRAFVPSFVGSHRLQQADGVAISVALKEGPLPAMHPTAEKSLCGTVARWLRLACLTMETKIALTRRAAAELALIGLIR